MDKMKAKINKIKVKGSVKVSKPWFLAFIAFGIILIALGSVFAFKAFANKGEEAKSFSALREVFVKGNEAEIKIRLTGEIPAIFIIREYLPEGLEVSETNGVFEVSNRSVKWIYIGNIDQYKNLDFWYKVVANKSQVYTVKGEVKVPYGERIDIAPSEFELEVNQEFNKIAYENKIRSLSGCLGLKGEEL
jgi:hypothetical protein